MEKVKTVLFYLTCKQKKELDKKSTVQKRKSDTGRHTVAGSEKEVLPCVVVNSISGGCHFIHSFIRSFSNRKLRLLLFMFSIPLWFTSVVPFTVHMKSQVIYLSGSQV